MATPLFVRSVYSLLSSMCTIKSIVHTAKTYGYKSVALVDKNVLSGAMSFYNECKKEDIKPLFGLEADIEISERIYPLMLMAKNDDGFKNLMGLSSLISTRNKKTIDLAELNRYRKDNFLILFSDKMPLTYVYDKNLDIENCLNSQEDLFGKDYLVALTDHNIASNARRDLNIKPLLKRRGIHTFALNRTYYINRDDHEEYEILKCIRDKRTIDDENEISDEGRYFMDPEEFSSLYDEDDLKNTDIIAQKLNVEMNFKTDLPAYKTKNGVDSKDYLVSLCKEGLRIRLKGNVTKEYSERMNYELKTIIQMHFEDYFLIVYDFILFAKKNNILVGPGRGSAAGSLVAYCLGITDIDPLKYGLLFERFLNPERITMPDIDTDFPDNKRDIVINYVRDKYGDKHVAHIITYGTLKARQVLRDVGRVLSYSTKELDMLCKLIPFAVDMTLNKALEVSPGFNRRISQDKRYQRLFEISSKFEGFPRHESTHAAGIVFSKLPLEEVVPLIAVESDAYSTQYTMEHLESLGLIKMDFLGLRNLGIIEEILEDINRNEKFDIRSIPLNDKKTFDLISSVNVLGVFQLESNGMQNLIRKLKPSTFEEIGMTIALFRPGPMENIPQFIENKRHPEKIQYISDELRPILEETYGIIVYQEQIMSIARKMAGFSYGKADILRRAMSKKKASELESLKTDFIDGCIRNGYSSKISESIYELILKFANYGFNKSHSIAYALVAYQMAYLKANYPLYFYKALLNGVIGSESKTYEYISECLSIRQKVKGISVNESMNEYIIKDNAIVMPLSICKDVGSVSVRKILEERNINGRFTDYVDTVCRFVNAGIDRNAIESLIYAGAFDEFGYGRYTMLNSLTNVIKYANAHKGAISLIGSLDDKPYIEELNDDRLVMAENEKRVLGFYFSFNPVTEIRKKNNITTDSLLDISRTKGYVKGFGLINRVKSLKTKKGDMMAFVDVSDEKGELSLAVMPNIYKDFSLLLVRGKYIYFEGKVDKESSCLVNRIVIY